MKSVEAISFILTMLLGGTVVLGIFIIVLLIRSNLGLAKWLLCLALGALLLHLLTFLLFTTEFIRAWPHYLAVSYPFLFLAGPAFYFFIKSYAEPNFTWSFKHLIHLVPAVLVALYLFPSTYILTTSEKQLLIDYYYDLAPQGVMSLDLWAYFNLYVVFLLGYVLASIWYIKDKVPYNAPTLRRFGWLFLALCVSYLILQSGLLLSGADFITSEILLSVIMALVVLLMGYWILDIHQLFPVARRYRTAPLSPSKVDFIKTKITQGMSEQKLYLNPRLTISQVADELEIPAHHLSQVINIHMNTNFYRLVNGYRIAKSQELLKTDRIQKVSIQAIGQDCGFSNKTSFYRAFKQHTGMTPVEYVRS